MIAEGTTESAVCAAQVFTALRELLPSEHAFQGLLAARPGVSVVLREGPVWVGLREPVVSGAGECDGWRSFTVDGHPLWLAGAGWLDYVLSGVGEHAPVPDEDGAPGSRALPADPLAELLGADGSMTVPSPVVRDAALCAELLLATSAQGPFVPTGACLRASPKAWLRVLGLGGWVVSEPAAVADLPARAWLSIGTVRLSAGELVSIGPGDLLLPDCRGFESTGQCSLRFGGCGRPVSVVEWTPGRRLIASVVDLNDAGERGTDDPAPEDVELDVVAGCMPMRALDLVRSDGIAPLLEIRHTLPSVILVHGGRQVGTGELLRSTTGLAVEILTVSAAA